MSTQSWTIAFEDLRCHKCARFYCIEKNASAGCPYCLREEVMRLSDVITNLHNQQARRVASLRGAMTRLRNRRR